MPANTTASSGSSGRRQDRQEEGATRPPDRDRPGAGARRGYRLRRVLVRQHRACLLPADQRARSSSTVCPGPSTSSATATESRRSTPTPTTDLFRAQGFVQAQDRFWEMDVRRHMTSGRLSEMFGSGPGRDGRLPAHAGLAPGRAGGVRHRALRGHEEVPPGVRRRGQRLPQGARRQGHLRRVRRARLHQRLQADQVDPGRLGRLAEGDGLGPARQHAGRDRPLADDQQAQPEADRGPVPGVPVRPATSRSSRRGEYRRVTERVRPGATSAVHRASTARTPGSQGATEAPSNTPALRRSPTPSTRSPRCSARTATASAPTPGSSPATTRPPASRCSPTTRTCRPQLPSRLVPDGPALPAALGDLPVRRRRLHLLRACPA